MSVFLCVYIIFSMLQQVCLTVNRDVPIQTVLCGPSVVLLEKSSVRQSDSWHRAARVLIRSPDGTRSRPRALLQCVHTWVKLHSHCRSLEMIKSWFILSDNRRRNLVGTLDRCRCLVEIIWYCEGFTDPVWSLLNWSQARVEPQYRKSACVVFSARQVRTPGPEWIIWGVVFHYYYIQTCIHTNVLKQCAYVIFFFYTFPCTFFGWNSVLVWKDRMITSVVATPQQSEADIRSSWRSCWAAVNVDQIRSLPLLLLLLLVLLSFSHFLASWAAITSEFPQRWIRSCLIITL